MVAEINAMSPGINHVIFVRKIMPTVELIVDELEFNTM
jgi:hypothetical protein